MAVQWLQAQYDDLTTNSQRPRLWQHTTHSHWTYGFVLVLANLTTSQNYTVGSRLALLRRGNLKCVFSGANNPTEVKSLWLLFRDSSDLGMMVADWICLGALLSALSSFLFTREVFLPKDWIRHGEAFQEPEPTKYVERFESVVLLEKMELLPGTTIAKFSYPLSLLSV